MNARIRKFKNTSRFFRHAFDINSGIHSTQQRVKELDRLKLNPSDQERRYKEQVINQNKDNTNTNNINGISNNFKNINNSAMKDSDNMKEIINKNIDSNKQIKESTEKDVRRKEKIICNASENCKTAPFEKISENDKTNFKCNFENILKNRRKKNMHKIVVGQININSIRNKFDHLMAAVSGNIDILLNTETKIDSTFPVNQFYLNGYNEMTVILTVVAFWFIFAMTLGHV